MTSEQDAYKIENQKAQHYANYKSGASWFFWLAAITVVNIIVQMSGNTLRFAVGLALGKYLELKPLPFLSGIPANIQAMGIGGLGVLVLILIGFLARKRNKIAYLVGMALYALDLIPTFLIGDLYSIIFHLIVIGFMVWGYINLMKLEKLETEYPDIEEKAIEIRPEA